MYFQVQYIEKHAMTIMSQKLQKRNSSARVTFKVCHKIKFHHFIEDSSMYSHCKIRISSTLINFVTNCKSVWKITQHYQNFRFYDCKVICILYAYYQILTEILLLLQYLYICIIYTGSRELRNDHGNIFHNHFNLYFMNNNCNNRVEKCPIAIKLLPTYVIVMGVSNHSGSINNYGYEASLWTCSSWIYKNHI